MEAVFAEIGPNRHRGRGFYGIVLPHGLLTITKSVINLLSVERCY